MWAVVQEGWSPYGRVVYGQRMGPGAEEEMPRKYKWTHTDVIWTPGGRNHILLIRGSLAPSTVPDIKRAAECLLLNKHLSIGLCE